MKVDPDKRFGTVLEMMNKISSIENNQNLDCKYRICDKTETWSINNTTNTHCDHLILEMKNATEFKLSGYKERLIDGNRTNNKKCTQSFSSKQEAYKVIEKIIDSY